MNRTLKFQDTLRKKVKQKAKKCSSIEELVEFAYQHSGSYLRNARTYIVEIIKEHYPEVHNDNILALIEQESIRAQDTYKESI